MTLSVDTLNLCAFLLSQVTLSPTADDFEDQAKVIGRARRELLAALAAADQPSPPNRAARRAKPKS